MVQLSVQKIVSHAIVPYHFHLSHFLMNLSKNVSLNNSSKHCLPLPHEFPWCIFCWMHGLLCFHNIWFLLQLVLFMTKLYYSANIPNKLFWSFCMQIPNTLGSHGNTLSLSDSINFACSKYHHPPSPFQRKQ